MAGSPAAEIVVGEQYAHSLANLASLELSGPAGRIPDPRAVIIVLMAKNAKQSKSTSDKVLTSGTFTRALAAGTEFVLAEGDPRSTPGFEGDKAAAAEIMVTTAAELADLQERL